MAGRQMHEDLYDIIIIGGGPAGLTAGQYASRAGLSVLLLEGISTSSQVIVTDLVENYPGIPEPVSGFELHDRFRRQAGRFGLNIRSEDVTSVRKVQLDNVVPCPEAGGPEESIDGWEIETSDDIYHALSLIVATGASWRRLGIDGEDTFLGKGVSCCATCDGPFYKDKNVVVIGGGDAAVQESIYLTRFARKVTIVHRRDRLRAARFLQERAFANEKIDFVWNSVPEEILGDDSVTGVKVRNVNSPNECRVIRADGVFVFIGLEPNTGIVRGLVELDDDGYIITDSTMMTSERSIFSCGDCIRKQLRQIVTACGDGATAAFSAQLYVETLKGQGYNR